MDYEIKNGKLLKCKPSIPDQVVESEGRRLRIATQELDLIIPEGVISIDRKAFDQVSSYVETILLPESLTSLEGFSFKSFIDLQKVVVAGNVKTIPNGLFTGNKTIKSVELYHPINCISESAFSNCRSLEYFSFLDGLERIERYAFYQCRKLKDFTFPSTIRYVGACAFCGASSIRDVVFQSSEGLYIGCGAFHENHRLRRIFIPEGVENLNHLAFSTSAKNIEVYLPSSVMRFEQEDDSKSGMMGGRFYGGLMSKWHDNRNNVSYPAITIIAPEDSFALKFAMKNSLPCKEE